MNSLTYKEIDTLTKEVYSNLGMDAILVYERLVQEREKFLAVASRCTKAMLDALPKTGEK